MFQAIAPNAFFVFASTFPTNNAIANLLLGSPVTFYQGLGDFTRGLRIWGVGAYVQDEWRVSRAPDAELRAALRAHQPDHRGRRSADRLHPRRAVAGAARRAARPGVPRRSRHRRRHRAQRQRRACRASASSGIRPATGCGRCDRATGSSTTSSRTDRARRRRVAVSAIPWAQFNQYSGQGLNFQNPYQGRAYPGARDVRAAVDGVRDRSGRQAALRAELEPQRAARAGGQLSGRGALRRRQGPQPAAQRRGEPGGLRAGRDRAERRSPPRLRQLPGRRRHLRLLDHRDAAQRHASSTTTPARPACRGASARASASTCRTGIRSRSTSCRR